jgi:energy-coupling factor transporter ATP-binding protein EcfA2
MKVREPRRAASNVGVDLPHQVPPGRCRLSANIREVRYSEDSRAVLSGIEFTVGTGEMVVVAGPSGSGKSTLALALAGLVPNRIGVGVWDGDVVFESEGNEPVELNELPLHRAAQHVGIVFQNPEFQLIQYQVDAEVAFGPENLALPREEVVARVASSLAKVGAEDLASSAISSLSGGQKQRVAIAAALAMSPPVLVLDEPTSDLDPVGTDGVLGVLHRLCHDDGHGVVVVEHKLDEVAPYADRIVLVVDGKVVVDDHPRRAFVPTSVWHRAGVRPPELVTLSEALPDAFPDGPALEVEEAAAALAGRTLVGDLPLSEVAEQVGRTVTGDRGEAFGLHGVSVRFGERVAVDEVSLGVREGEWVALIGANGSGKTTMGSVLMGFARPATGAATCFGHSVAFGKIPVQAAHSGYLFQNVDDMLFCDTVGAELDFTRRNRVPTGANAPEATEVAELIGLAGRLDSHPYALSGGERQRLALGALLTRAPRGLILDEPTTGLDEAHAEALFELLARVRTSLGSLTCLLITHDMRLVARFADRVVLVGHGRVVLDTTPRRLFAQVDTLERWGVRPPPIASLHSRLVGGTSCEVAVSVEELLRLLGPAVRVGGLHVASD